MEGGFRPRRRVASVVAQGRPKPPAATAHASPSSDMLTPEEVDEAWRRLLEERLSPDKREVLNETYLAESDPRQRYNMLLEFSSYLRQGLNNPDGDGASSSARARQPGVPRSHGYDDDDVSLCWEVSRVLIIVFVILGAVLGAIFYVHRQLEEATQVKADGAGFDTEY